MRKRFIAKALSTVLGALLFVGPLIWWWNSDPERRWGCFRNDYALCRNCQSFIGSVFEQYMMETKDTWFPRGGSKPPDSLARLSPYGKGGVAGFFTSHALAPRLAQYYKQHGTFTYDLMSLRYNQGLREDDPPELIVLYYHAPTRWDDRDTKRYFLGRPIFTVGNLHPTWEFLPEEDFQTRQARTLRYLSERHVRSSEIQQVLDHLKLIVTEDRPDLRSYQFRVTLQNAGGNTAGVTFLEWVCLLNQARGSRGRHPFGIKGHRISVHPQEDVSLDGWLKLEIDDTVRDGRIVSRVVTYAAENDQVAQLHDSSVSIRSTGTSSGGNQGGMGLADFNAQYFIQASAHIRVDIGAITNLELVLRSDRKAYLLDTNAHYQSIQATK